MSQLSKKDPFLLFLGDICVFLISLWLTLGIRFGHIPTVSVFESHLIPFSILFAVWYIVFFIAGLYEKRTIILRHKLPATILRVQVINSLIGVLFFYFIPYFGITPKTILFIYLLISFFLFLLWRIYGYILLGPTHKQNALLVSSGQEMRELIDEVNSNEGYSVKFISSIDLDKSENIDFQTEIVERIYSEDVSLIVVDFRNEKVDPIVTRLYNLLFSNIAFIDMYKIYEDIFNRIPLSLIEYSWFIENISLAPKQTYDFLKRIMDIILSLIAGIISLPFALFAVILIKLEDRGPILIMQERVGQDNKLIRAYKFRSMSRNETDLSRGGDNKITNVGAFLRKTRIDEIPQILSVIKGDMSLIGPRPELPSGVKHYEELIPYYNVRHLIKPGLSGWAQIYHDNHPHHGFGVEQTREKLSYDLYYLKNRSFLLDVVIALKTIKKLLSRSGI